MTSIELAIRTRLDVIFSKYTPNPQLTEFKEALDDTFAQLGILTLFYKT